MTVQSIDGITSYRTHIYFEDPQAAIVQTLRQDIEARFSVALGR